MKTKHEYFRAQLDNGADFDGFTLPEVREKITEYYLDMERERCPEATSIERCHDDTVTMLNDTELADFNSALTATFDGKVVESHYQAEHDRGTAQMGGR